MIKLSANLLPLVDPDALAETSADVGDVTKQIVDYRPITSDKSYSLKNSLLGPTVFNKHRANEYLDSLILQGAWAIPGAAVGSYFGLSGAVAGISAGTGVGKIHTIAKDFARRSEARDKFSPLEYDAANEMLDGTVKGGLIGATLGGITGLGANMLLNSYGYNTGAIPLLISGLGWGGLLGGLSGRSMTRNDLLKSQKYKKLLERYN